VNIENVGAKYPTTGLDADGDFLDGSRNYKLHVPQRVPLSGGPSILVGRLHISTTFLPCLSSALCRSLV